MPAFVDAALAGRPLPIDGDGTQTRDFTFVDTVAAVDRRRRRPPGHATPSRSTWRSAPARTCSTLIDLLERVIGHPLERQHRPSRVGDVRHSQADSARLRALFPDIEPVPLEDGLAATVEWMRTVSRA